jgi:hypothetical protein
MRKAVPRQHIAQAMNSFVIAVKIREPQASPHRHFQLSPNNFHNPPMRLPRRSASIHGNDPLRLSCRNRQVTLPHPSKERTVLLLEAVFIAMMFPRALVRV